MEERGAGGRDCKWAYKDILKVGYVFLFLIMQMISGYIQMQILEKYMCSVCYSAMRHVCSVVSDSATTWIVASQGPPAMEFSKQEYWSELPFPSPGSLPNRGIELTSLVSPALAGRFFTS